MKVVLLTLTCLFMMTRPGSSENIKTPNVAGQFYSADARGLAAEVEGFLRTAGTAPIETAEIVIAPHAGYMYSGAVAGHSFKAVSGRKFTTIVILAPSHFYGFDGASVWGKGGFQTPLGTVPVDEEFSAKLTASDPKFYFEPRAFSREHSLEVEIPFLQKAFSGFKIVPVILGQMSLETSQKLANALNKIIADRKDVLVVVSSDMSHYHDGAFARKMDLSTLETIKSLDAAGLYKNCVTGAQEMCGFVPVATALLLAKERGLAPRVLKYAHSGDVTGDNSRVVGYGAVAFYKREAESGKRKEGSTNDERRTTNYEPRTTNDERPASSVQRPGVSPLNNEQKKQLLAIARKTIEKFVQEKKVFEVKVSDPRLMEPEGAFVTVHKHGNLRGCIGHIISDQPLYKTVRDVAISAASEDPRFPPVSVEELKDIDVEVSVLSRPWQIKDVKEIEMGKHGVIISRGMRRGLFLPQVATETGWTKEKFLAELCSQKAGLSPDCWKDPATRIEIFTADVFAEKDVN